MLTKLSRDKYNPLRQLPCRPIMWNYKNILNNYFFLKKKQYALSPPLPSLLMLVSVFTLSLPLLVSLSLLSPFRRWQTTQSSVLLHRWSINKSFLQTPCSLAKWRYLPFTIHTAHTSSSVKLPNVKIILSWSSPDRKYKLRLMWSVFYNHEGGKYIF